MAIAFVKDATTIVVPGDAVTVPAGGFAAGNLIAFAGMWDDTSSTVSGVTDTAGNSYSAAVTAAANGHTVTLWYSLLANALVSGNTIVASLAGNDGIWIAAEFSGIATSPLDQAPTANTDTTASSHTSGTTATTAQADELLLGVHGNVTNQAYTSTGGYTQNEDLAAFSLFHLSMQYLIVSATGAYASTCTTAGTTNSNNLIATFKAAGTSPTSEAALRTAHTPVTWRT